MCRDLRPPRIVLLGSLLIILLSAALTGSVAPLPEGAAIAWSHAPFELGECSLCHVGESLPDPGPVDGEINELCFGCHEETEEAMASAQMSHYAAEESCTSCHNPHNAAYPKLLQAEAPDLCAECHSDVWEEATEAKVQHTAVTSGRACLACHSPHASNVDSLLTGLPYDLCVNCHTEQGLTDDQGVLLTNFGELLVSNPVAHGPVAARDCSACHQPHGGETFRLLVEQYPSKFYAPFDPDNYRLCFTCHNEEVVAQQETSTLTGFRDGSTNLHFVHVNKEDRGRTCRACHEVHAAPQQHLIRDGVPYGKKGWILKINYKQEANGGTCEKTCHATKSYDRSLAQEVQPGAAP